MIYLRKPSHYWLQHLLCSTMATELSCPSPAHITFYLAVPYLTIICHNNKLHVLCCLQSLPLVLSKNHENLILFSALIQQSACKRKHTVPRVSYILPGFYYIQICSVFLLLVEVFLTKPLRIWSQKAGEWCKISLNLSALCSWNFWVIFPHRRISPLAERPLPFPRHA